jgi:hypothetical protein
MKLLARLSQLFFVPGRFPLQLRSTARSYGSVTSPTRKALAPTTGTLLSKHRAPTIDSQVTSHRKV